MKENIRLQVVMHFPSLIISSNLLIHILKLLPQKERIKVIDLVENINPYVKSENSFFSYFIKILSLIDSPDRFTYFQKNKQNFHLEELQQLLSLLPSSDCYTYLNTYTNLTGLASEWQKKYWEMTLKLFQPRELILIAFLHFSEKSQYKKIVGENAISNLCTLYDNNVSPSVEYKKMNKDNFYHFTTQLSLFSNKAKAKVDTTLSYMPKKITQIINEYNYPEIPQDLIEQYSPHQVNAPCCSVM